MSVSLRKFDEYGICGCEHIQHEGVKSAVPGRLHAEYKVPASSVWAAYVGHVCEWCAEHCLPAYVMPEHDCSEPESDCAKYPHSDRQFNTPIVSEYRLMWEYTDAGYTVELSQEVGKGPLVLKELDLSFPAI